MQNKLNYLQNKATENLELPLEQDKKVELFKRIFIPFAKEQGFDFSIKDIMEYEKSIVEHLNEEQMQNIVAGKFDGINCLGCIFWGVGFGLFIGGYYPVFCLAFGLGYGAGICFVPGVGTVK